MSEDGGVTVKFNLFNLVQQLGIQRQRRYSWAEVAKLSGLHQNTILKLANNETHRIDLETIEKLLTFFEREEMPVSLSDLFTVSRAEAA
jgi:transcriptional regulator with XRE-family HTH domain